MIRMSFFTCAVLTLSLIANPIFATDNNHITSQLATSGFITNEPGIYRTYSLNELRICATDLTNSDIEAYGKELLEKLEIIQKLDWPVNFKISYDITIENQPTIHAIFIGAMGTIGISYWNQPRLLTVDIQRHTQDPIDHKILLEITKDHFGLIESAITELPSYNLKEENNKVEIRDNQALGRGVFATKDIKKGELIGGLYGDFHEAPDSMSLPDEYRDHVMQCGETVYRGNKTQDGVTQYMNHSCDPNCGAKGLFDFVAIKDIKAGEELTSDYAMEDDSNWVVQGGKCLCGTENCRGEILPYSKLTQEEKEKINEHTSHWILHKHGICSCSKKNFAELPEIDGICWTNEIKKDLEKYFGPNKK